MDFSVFLSPQMWLIAAIIFVIRAVGLAVDTLRVFFIIRGQKIKAWIASFITVILFIVVFSQVVTEINNPLYLIGFASGFASGTLAGIIVENYLGIGFIQVNITSSSFGAAIAEQLRKNGFAVTEISARGRDGTVELIRCDTFRNQVDQIHTIVIEIDPAAFVTAKEIRPINRGFWRKQ